MCVYVGVKVTARIYHPYNIGEGRAYCVFLLSLPLPLSLSSFFFLPWIVFFPFCVVQSVMMKEGKTTL